MPNRVSWYGILAWKTKIQVKSSQVKIKVLSPLHRVLVCLVWNRLACCGDIDFLGQTRPKTTCYSRARS